MLKATSSSTYKCVTVHIVRPAATARTEAGAVIHFVHIKAHFSVREEGGYSKSAGVWTQCKAKTTVCFQVKQEEATCQAFVSSGKFVQN